MVKGSKGPPAWNKGKTGIYSEETLRKIREARAKQTYSLETRKKISVGNLGKKRTPEQCRSIKERQLGHTVSKETRLKISEALKGEKNFNWKGGVTKPNALLRKSPQYKKWRKEVLKRDREECVLCHAINVRFHVDHIKSFAFFPELRFDLANGRTLCIPCHKETDTYGKPYAS